MLAMENSTRQGRVSQLQSALKQRRSGYEPSDTETEWQDSPWRDLNNDGHPRDGVPIEDRPKTPMRFISPLGRNKRYLSNLDSDISPPVRALRTSPIRRRNSKSPYKPRRNDGTVVSPKADSLESEQRRNNISPYKTRREESIIDDEKFVNSNRKQNHRMHQKRLDLEKDGTHSKFIENSRVNGTSHYMGRSLSAPKPRAKEKEQISNLGPREHKGGRSPSPLSRSQIRKQREASHVKAPSANEINEMVATVKPLKGPSSNVLNLESTDSISPGDIFFSQNYTPLASQKNVLTKPNSFPPRPKVVSERDTALHQRSRVNTSFNQNTHVVSSGTIASRTNTSSSYAGSRQSSIKNSVESSKISDGSGRSSDSFKKFTANRQKSQKDTWFGCVRKGPCKTFKSPEKAREFDEALFIEKAFVVENLRPFWADKHRPGSLNGFTCHKQEAQLLKQLISHNSCPHILFKGPSGSGKKALTMALLSEIYGDPAWNITHDLRYFDVQEKRPMQVVFPLTSSPHHVELNLKSESHNARYALMALVKQLTNNHEITPEISTADFSADYKVIVLYEVDKLAENVQHLIKWIMDCYTDACKIILCCEDDVEILDSVKSRCEVITVDAPVTHEIMEVLIQIAKKENFDLPMSFAAKIATKSKQNLRKAIMALEACKSHNYPFVDEQPIPLGWEEVLTELAAEILADPSPKRLFFTRGKFQKLLVDFVHPKLILQKLVEQFLKGVEASLKRELYYWHAYYDKRLPLGTSALLKLEEFVAKFMSIYRKSFRG